MVDLTDRPQERHRPRVEPGAPPAKQGRLLPGHEVDDGRVQAKVGVPQAHGTDDVVVGLGGVGWLQAEEVEVDVTGRLDRAIAGRPDDQADPTVLGGELGSAVVAGVRPSRHDRGVERRLQKALRRIVHGIEFHEAVEPHPPALAELSAGAGWLA